jgi:hypothetical protein
MQSIAPLFAIVLALAVYSVILWITWKFYGALARIGEELGEIKTVLRLRLPPLASPAIPDDSSPRPATK